MLTFLNVPKGKTPLDDLPFNTTGNFISATFKSGCELFVPIHIDSNVPDVIVDQVLTHKKHELQQYLNTLPD